MNVCCHAYPEGTQGVVSIGYSVPAQGELSVEIADQGAEFDPLTAAPPNLSLDLKNLPVGGLGIFLVKRLAKSLSYRREQGWNRLTFGVSAGG
jgi:anti-sigma regulatory factor (Ser/Thr protein kinase)